MNLSRHAMSPLEFVWDCFRVAWRQPLHCFKRYATFPYIMIGMLLVWIYVTKSGEKRPSKLVFIEGDFNGGKKLSLSDLKVPGYTQKKYNVMYGKTKSTTNGFYNNYEDSDVPYQNVFKIQQRKMDLDWHPETIRVEKNAKVSTLTLTTNYLLNNPSLCSDKNISYVILVYSAVDHFMNRTTIRNTWGSTSLFPHGRVIFLVGTSGSPQIQKHVEEESKKEKDILQGQFIDSDRNLTHKGVMGLRWVTEYCSRAKAAIKTDDDVVFNTQMFLDRFFPLFDQYQYLMLGNILENDTMPIIRNNASTWYVPEDEPWFIGRTKYPKYMSGLFVGLSMDVVKSLYLAAFDTPFFWIDDVYLFGLLARKMKNVTYVSIGRANPLHCDKTVDCYNSGTPCPILVTACKIKNITKVNLLWRSMKRQRVSPLLDLQTLIKPAPGVVN